MRSIPGAKNSDANVPESGKAICCQCFMTMQFAVSQYNPKEKKVWLEKAWNKKYIHCI